jgi:hypothetical protein
VEIKINEKGDTYLSKYLNLAVDELYQEVKIMQKVYKKLIHAKKL